LLWFSTSIHSSKEAESIESDKVKKLREKELEKASATAKAAAEAEAIAKVSTLTFYNPRKSNPLSY